MINTTVKCALLSYGCTWNFAKHKKSQELLEVIAKDNSIFLSANLTFQVHP